jgi:hypothetical protein
MSRELLHHRIVTTIRCGPCGLLNPAFDASPKLPEHSRAKLPIDAEVINLDDSPVPKPILPPQRRGLASQIPAIPNFKLGYAEKDRQTAKPKSSYTPTAPTVHFSVGVARYTWNELGDVDEGSWSTASDHWTVTEDNRVLTPTDLLASILARRVRTSKGSCKAENSPWLASGFTGYPNKA